MKIRRFLPIFILTTLAALVSISVFIAQDATNVPDTDDNVAITDDNDNLSVDATPTVVLPVGTPQQIVLALADLSTLVGTEVTISELTGYQFQGFRYLDASLDCPQPDTQYAQVQTPGFQFILDYAGVLYDYRVANDETIVFLCSQTVIADLTLTPGAVIGTPVAQATEIPAVATPVVAASPIIAIAPLSGDAGTSVQLIANGLPRNRLFSVSIGQSDSSEENVLRTVRSDNSGVLSATVTIPLIYAPGTSLVLFVSEDTDNVRADSLPFIVTGTNADTGAVTGNPIASVSADTGAPGEDLTLTASGFPANASVLIGVGPVNAVGFDYSLRETTDAQGNLTIDIEIPEEAQVNQAYVALVEVENDRDYEATTQTFTPIGTVATAVPDGGEFTTANIYLVALGDDGVSGTAFGCSDSTVAVPVTFSPTVAPLTSALTSLFGIDTRFYGQSGLYNAFYQSSLAIDSIDISNSVATINLSGSLVTGGVCDTPRVSEQIRQTALQFSNITDVQINLNGQPLDS